jgi:branched-chain amino acid transport system substrate-binding protein
MTRRLLRCLLLCAGAAVGVAAQPLPNDRMSVGVIIPLTGGLADFAVATRNGIELARAADPTTFSRIQFVYEDSRYDPKEALSAFQRLTLNSKPDLVYNWGTGPNQAVIPAAESKHVPLLAMTTEAAISSNKAFVLRFSNYAEQYSLALLRYLREREFKHLAVVQGQVAYFEEVVRGIKKNLSQDESLDFVELIQPSDNDFRSLIVKLKRRRIDALGVFVAGGQISEFFRQARDLGLVKPFFGSNTFENPTEIRAAQGAMEGAVYPTIRATDEFRKLYLKQYGDNFQVAFAALGYDLALLCKQLLDKNPKRLSPTEMMKALRNSLPINGATGQMRYLEGPEAGPGFDFPVGLRVVRGETSVDWEAGLERQRR